MDMLKNRLLKNFNTIFCCFVLIVFSLIIRSDFCEADDAMVLPKNRWMTNLGIELYPAWGKKYNDDGKAEDIAFDYSRELTKEVIPLLAQLEAYVTDPSLGRSIVDFERSAVITNIIVSYGITDKLSFGIKIPYWRFKTKVSTDLDKSSANVAKNPSLQDPNSPYYGVPLVPTSALPAAIVDQYKLGKEDILNLLSDGITELGIPGYGYDKLETWSSSGIGDIKMNIKYQYLQNDKWRLAVGGGICLPTGKDDDPDNLVDYAFGGGSYDLSIAAQNDYIGFKNFVLNGSLRYTNQLPDETTLRIPDSVDQPLTTNKEKVDRDQGDILETEFSATYSLPKGFGIRMTYGAFFKNEDKVEGSNGRISSLEEETDQTGHTMLIGCSYNNLSLFQKKLARVPFQVSLNYWNRFNGKNMNKATYYSAKGALFF